MLLQKYLLDYSVKYICLVALDMVDDEEVVDVVLCEFLYHNHQTYYSMDNGMAHSMDHNMDYNKDSVDNSQSLWFFLLH